MKIGDGGRACDRGLGASVDALTHLSFFRDPKLSLFEMNFLTHLATLIIVWPLFVHCNLLCDKIGATSPKETRHWQSGCLPSPCAGAATVTV